MVADKASTSLPMQEQLMITVRNQFKSMKKNKSSLAENIDPDNIDATQVVKNFTNWFWEFRHSQGVKMLAPFFVISIWSSITPVIGDDMSTWIARIMFASKAIFFLAIFASCKSKIQAKIDDGEMERIIEVEVQKWNDEVGYEKVKENITIGEHDLRAQWDFMKKELMATGITLMIHYWFGMTIPLVITTVMAGFQYNVSPLYKVYIAEMDPTDDDYPSRPWKEDAQSMQGMMDRYYESAQKAGWTQETVAETAKAKKKMSSKSIKAQMKNANAINSRK